MYLPIYLGGDGFCGKDGHSSTNLFGKEVKFIYLLNFGKGWPLIYPSTSTLSFGRGWPLTYPCIWEGNGIYLPIYLGGDAKIYPSI